MSDTPITDEVSREIGRIAFPLRTRDISLPEFVDLAQAQMDKVKKLERELNESNERVKGLLVDLHAASEKIKRIGRWHSQHCIDIQNLTETIRYRESQIKRLEEAGDAMALFCADEVSLEQWNDAKKNQSQKENNQ